MVSDAIDKTNGGFVPVSRWVSCGGDAFPVYGKVRTLKTASMKERGCSEDALVAWWCSLGPGEVVWVSGSKDWAFWGELCTRLALRIGLVGTVVDGLTRDTRRVRKLGYPVLARGVSGRDIYGRGHVVGVDCAVEVDGMTVNPGDLAYLDSDGLAVVRRDAQFAVRNALDHTVKEEAGLARELRSEPCLETVLRKRML